MSNLTIDQIHEIKELGIDASIKTVAKDTCNQIWVGADNGLYRFDGKKVDVFDFRYVKAIKRLQNEQIAVLTDEGLFSISTAPYSCEVDTLLLSSQSTSSHSLFFPKSLYEDKYGAIWIGEDSDIVRFKNGQIRRFKFDGISSNGFLHRSYDFVEDGFGQLWAIAYGGYLLQYDFEKEIFKIVKAGIWEEVSAASSLGNNEIWIGAKDGVHKIVLNPSGDFLSTVKVSSIPRVSKIKWINGYALIATWENGMYKIDYQGNREEISNLQHTQIFDFFIEKNELWIASRENITCIYLFPVELILETKNKFIPSVNLLKNNRLVINTGKSIYLIKQSYAGFSQELIFTAPQDFWINNAILIEDNLWMVTSRSVHTFHLDTRELKEIVSIQERDWRDKIFLDSKGVIWISGKTKEPVISIKNGKIKYWEKIKDCLSIVENEQGILFAAGEGGTIFRKKDEDFESLDIELFSKQKLTINTLQFSKNQLFLATDKGLWTTSAQSIQKSKPNLIFEGNVSSLAIDKYNNLWFGHNQGLTFLQSVDSTLLHFNSSNGLPSKHIVSDGLAIDVNQQIWMNTSKGVARANAKLLTQDQTPKPHLSMLYVQNKKRTVSSSFLGVFHTEQFISLSMSALTFPTADIEYRGTLYNNDEVYSQWGAQGIISFADLKQGNYILKVEAKQRYSQWSQPVYYTFLIKNPWYKTTWFHAIVFVSVLSLFVLGARLYNQRLRRSNEGLELLVAKRTENIERQKNALIRNKNQIIAQQKEIIQKNTDLAETQKALTASEIKYLEVKRDQIQSALALRTKELTTHTLYLVEKNQLLLDISKKLEALSQNDDHAATTQNIKNLSRQIKNASKNENHWESFRLYFEQVHTDFYTKLKIAYPQLTVNDLKQCALVKLNLSLEDSATLLGVSSESVRVSRYRIQKKMGLSSQANFYDYLMQV